MNELIPIIYVLLALATMLVIICSIFIITLLLYVCFSWVIDPNRIKTYPQESYII